MMVSPIRGTHHSPPMDAVLPEESAPLGRTNPMSALSESPGGSSGRSITRFVLAEGAWLEASAEEEAQNDEHDGCHGGDLVDFVYRTPRRVEDGPAAWAELNSGVRVDRAGEADKRIWR